MLSTNKFRSAAKDAIAQIESEQYGRNISHEEIEMVFMGYVLGNIKGTFVVPKNTEGRYYEITYGKSSHNLYIDTYEKKGNIVINLN